MQTPTAKFQPIHGVEGNAPVIFSVISDKPVTSQRCFSGVGPPSATTLNAGNGKFCGLTSGWVIAASSGAIGGGYAVGDILTASGGTFTTATVIKVDAVNASGGVLDSHVSTAGNYSVYPANAVSVTGGTGAGATFNLAFQPADSYIDTTNPAAPVLYACKVSGDSTSATWAIVSGGFPWQSPKELDPTKIVSTNTFVYISPNNPLVGTGLVDLVSGNMTLAQAGIWQARVDVPAQVTVGGVVKYNVPQLPYLGVSGTGDLDNASVYWILWSQAPVCY